jgi:hypothetical protein
MLGCVLMGVAILALSACGGDGTAGPASAATTQPQKRAKADATGERCPHQVRSLLNSLETLRRQLAIGLSYEQYAAKMRDIRARYDAIPVDRLAIDCLATAGTPGEQALNQYIDAANAWGECLADASCTTASIEPVLQRKWRVASHFLSQAQ